MARNKKNKLRVDYTSSNAIIDAKLKNYKATNDQSTLMDQLLTMTDTSDKTAPIIEYINQNKDILDNKDQNTDEKDEEGDDKMMDDNEDEDNVNNDGNDKQLSHREKYILKKQLRNDVSELKVSRKKFKKRDVFQKSEKKSITKEIKEKIAATLKSKK
ncbi:hypothetical protein DLAC_05201 [Tieghemostelium lacteum]|uniref:Uncharacterized protein n=1 Tax=Tieghemostelium lacteum TaxID=361077 RepID=A0A151ZIM2_TIELA|nr:hypothetical protein DLAC_05201 [Tieghemostelium lacteum]|eukprot:KYQ93806.1 hypothetical protein DLAC_05201 [Tieghemostelium lacteum]